MHRRFAILMLTVAISLGSIAKAQIRDSVQPISSSGSYYSGQGNSSSMYAQNGNAQASASDQVARTRGGTGIVDRIIFPRQDSGYNSYHGNGYNNSSYRGNRVSYYGRGYLYSAAVVVPANSYPINASSPYTTYYGNEAAPANTSNSAIEATTNAALELAYRQGMLDQKVRSLGEELERMRAEKAARDAEAARREPVDDSQTAPARKPLPDTITIVYLDGRRQDITNYAFVGQTLWILDEQHSFRVPVTEIDLSATRKLNIERGVEFVLPAAR